MFKEVDVAELQGPWSPLSREELREMLEKIGIDSIEELFKDVPENVKLKEPLKAGYGKSLSEWEITRIFLDKMARNKIYMDPPPFMGGGLCYHTVPSIVRYIISRAEFFTAYTPYQAEINQGLLQALFEYQSLMAELLEMDIVNASMYDMSTAAAEAVLMALRVTRRKKILVAGNIHPERLEVIKTWLYGKDVALNVIDYSPSTGRVSLESLSSLLSRDVAAVYVENPSFYGAVEEEVEAISDLVHKYGALFIIGFEPLSLGLIKPPGAYGADIAVGEGQPLGLGLYYGGSTLGILATRAERRLVRQLPGRLIGMTKTVDGERGFAMILQTREQHIRREKATSNITTNTALLAIAAAVYLSLLGERGLREISEAIWVKSHYTAKKLSELKEVKSPYFDYEFFKEFTVEFPVEYSHLHRELRKRGILGGLPLSRFSRGNGAEKQALLCVTEAHSISDIDRFVGAVGEILG